MYETDAAAAAAAEEELPLLDSVQQIITKEKLVLEFSLVEKDETIAALQAQCAALERALKEVMYNNISTSYLPGCTLSLANSSCSNRFTCSRIKQWCRHLLVIARVLSFLMQLMSWLEGVLIYPIEESTSVAFHCLSSNINV